MFIFLFKQKTAYEMRISDWSSDVCSSDLIAGDEALYLQEASDLLDTFTGSVSLGESVEGNVLKDGEHTPGVAGTPGGDADEGGAAGISHLTAVTVGGKTFTVDGDSNLVESGTGTASGSYDDATQVLTIQTDTGDLENQRNGSGAGD